MMVRLSLQFLFQISLRWSQPYGTIQNTFLPPYHTTDDHPGDASDDEKARRSRELPPPSVKIAGVRQTKKRKRSDSTSKQLNKLASDGPSKSKKGRTAGSPNYNDDDKDKLLELMEDILPVGHKGLNTLEDRFNEWAVQNNRPKRKASSLETKFKQVSKFSRPYIIF
jgi:hypothetical protein